MSILPLKSILLLPKPYFQYPTHPYETIGKIVVFCKLACAFWGFETDGSMFSRNLPLVNFFVERILVHKTRSGKKRKNANWGGDIISMLEAYKIGPVFLKYVIRPHTHIFRVFNMPAVDN